MTENIGFELGSKLPLGSVIALFGDLGAGKTAFTRGFTKGMGIECDVSSPTFALVNEYRGKNKTLYHFDMYRINGWDDLYSTGYFDYLDTGASLIIEWSENIPVGKMTMVSTGKTVKYTVKDGKVTVNVPKGTEGPFALKFNVSK